MRFLYTLTPSLLHLTPAALTARIVALQCLLVVRLLSVAGAAAGLSCRAASRAALAVLSSEDALCSCSSKELTAPLLGNSSERGPSPLWLTCTGISTQ